MKPVRLGLVGAGGIAQAYAQALRESAVTEIVGVADVRLEAAHAMAEDCGCSAFSCHKKLVENTQCDAVVLATPPVTHPEICVELTAHGASVLCEKPLAVDSTSAREMLEHARGTDVLVTMASKFRYVEDVIRAKSILASGVIGDAILFENTFAAQVDMSQRWNSNPKIAGGGVLIDNGTHSVDIVRYLLGPVAEVSAAEGRRIQGLDVEDTVRLQLRTTSGVLASVDLSWSLGKQSANYIEIYGSTGAIELGWQGSKFRSATSPQPMPLGDGYNKFSALRRQVENFCLALRGEESLLITPDDALASVLVVEAAYRSMQTRSWVSVDEVGGARPAA